MDTLDSLAFFGAALAKYYDNLPSDSRGVPQFHEAVIGEMHCAGCGDTRRMRSELLFPRIVSALYATKSYNVADEALILCRLRCVQCDAPYTALKYQGPAGPVLAMLPSTNGGLSTPHTPEAVAYYLDQAHKARSLGANSAAMAMFRAALEQLLYGQGYQAGMLDRKIKDLEAAIADNSAPAWARELDTDYLKAIKELGNGAIHTNGGDVKKQENLDSQLIVAVEATVAGLLHLIYEIPHMKMTRLTDLKAKATLLK
jgi:hypothetical protein